MSCSRTQHGGGRSRTPDLSLRSPTLYHWATALPYIFICQAPGRYVISNHYLTSWQLTNRPCQNGPYPYPCLSILIRAASWQNQQNDCEPSKDPDQPGHLPSLIRVFAVHMKKAWVLIYLLSAQGRLCSDWADAQADLSLHWAHMPFCWFCHEVVHMPHPNDTQVNVHTYLCTTGVYALAFIISPPLSNSVLDPDKVHAVLGAISLVDSDQM